MSITPESVKQLVESEDYGDRLRGLNQLDRIDPAVAFEYVKPALNDENPRVRYTATSKMASLGRQDLPLSLDLLRLRLYNDPEMDVKAAAADSLGALQLKEAYDDLVKLYRSTDDWIVQMSVVAALSELGEPRALELLEEAVGHPTEIVQTTAISALGEIGDPKAIPWIEPFVNHPEPQTRLRVAQALGHIGGDAVRPTLEKLANDSDAQVAERAKYCLDNL
ncbi:phycocyanin alpha phycocyanobilin lyase [Leptolyngbya valderiana BDU 20041]|nr:HEAT repeat domain-containing protein [Geitlerinema sp. CS-897]OAB62296.1 phycocyanin alpha phycocyanobilin lyase [Leptolyngbya valderiana BDU 20041]PPT06284.1 Phycocyanin alpha phycocyanobilin lyase related protein NblB [Geitlerinema sp. FC II]